LDEAKLDWKAGN